MSMIKIGMDFYVSKYSLRSILAIAYRNDIALYHIKRQDNQIVFYAKVKDRKKINECFPHTRNEYTTGLIGMFLRIISDKSRIISLGIAVILLCFIHHLTYDIEIYGNSNEIDDRIYEISKPYLYRLQEGGQLKKEIKEELGSELSFIEVYTNGNNVEIRYKKKENIELKEKNEGPLVAQKDGLIASFDVSSGFKQYKINDTVKAGDIIVNNEMIDSNNLVKNIEVEGKVYAYTWTRINVEMKEIKGNDAYSFYLLLLEARNMIELETKEEYIVEENVLQYYTSDGKMYLEVLFSVYEDITS